MEVILNKKRKGIIHNKNFLLLLCSQIISNIGSAIHYSAIIWFIMSLVQQNKSGMYIGIFTSCTLIVTIIFGPLAGVFADRFSRKSIIVYTNLIRGLLVLILALLAYLNVLNILLIIAVSSINALLGALFNPAVSASIPNLVEGDHLTKANSLNGASSQITIITGAAISGILYYYIGIFGIFVIDGISFIVAGILNTFIALSGDKIEGKVSDFKLMGFITDLKEGIRFIKNQKVILTLFAFAVIINFVGSPTFQILVPKIIRYTLGMNARVYGIVEAMLPAGALLALVILSLFPEREKNRNLIVYGIIADGLLFASVGILLLLYTLVFHGNVMLTLILLCIVFAGLGFVNTIVSVPSIVIFQKIVPNEYLGRFFGLFTTLTQGLIPLGLAIFGVISDVVLPLYIFLGTGTIVFFLGIWMCFIHELKEI